MDNILIQEKIELEKRKRNQAYLSLNYQLNTTSSFDFFSADAFTIVQNSKYIAYSRFLNKVELKHFISSFLYLNSDLLQILTEFGIYDELINFIDDQKKSTRTIKNVLNKQELKKIFNLSYLQSILNKENFCSFLKDEKLNLKWKSLKRTVSYIFPTIQNENYELPRFSDELVEFFEKANKNSLEKFKTAIVTPEILFFTLINDSKLFSDFIKKNLKNNLSFEFLKYRLFQRIHRHESNIRDEVPTNYHYFVYLLKSQLSEKEFEYLITNEMLLESVLYFRNIVISKSLQKDIFNILLSETKRSMRLTRFVREYSS